MISRLLDFFQPFFISEKEFQKLCQEQDQWVEEMNAKQLSEWLEENRNRQALGLKTEFTDDVPF